ncbi:hypothetical protein K2173_018445 [Erythroxylum novogranatense]|uniref:RCC1-like domain-containing protein n=1 Tax=Erythroxylum novogranatense TaxID=1862640 RepID=A0AAV8UF63_9ROSI|nr:hypothetical protein K2173_018445 [Erythroxylum novogranatense]
MALPTSITRKTLLFDLIITCSSTRFLSTQVMSFGDGTHGALGLPSSIYGIGAHAYEPSAVPGLPSDVVGVSAGHYHSLAITSQGELWAWGRNEEAQLGRGLLATRGTWNEPKRVGELNKVNVIGASASAVVTAAVGDDGSLWVWGKSKRGQLGLGQGVTEALVPSRVKALAGEKITKVANKIEKVDEISKFRFSYLIWQVSFGWGHALAQTEDGKLFGWGYSADGRIGKIGGPLLDFERKHQQDDAENLATQAMEKEKDMAIVWEPRLVEELQFHGVEIVDSACGLDHSLVLCRDGTILSSGSNTYGQLGRANRELGLVPVDLAYGGLSVAAGLGHSLAICSSKKIVSWGWNHSKQLGRAGSENVVAEVEGSFGDEIPISVCGGRAHSIALTSKGEVWAWGCGKGGRLGLWSSTDEPQPIMVHSLEGAHVVRAVSGFDHNLVLVTQ